MSNVDPAAERAVLLEHSSRRRYLRSIEETREEVVMKLKYEQSTYHLVTAVEYRRCHGAIKSNIYNQFSFLSQKGTTDSTGWLLCDLAMSGAFPISDAVQPSDTKQGTTSLRKHAETQSRLELNL